MTALDLVEKYRKKHPVKQNSNERSEKSKVFDIKTLKDWFVEAAFEDKSNFMEAFRQDINRVADTYAKNRLGSLTDEDAIKRIIASVVPKLNNVFKIIHNESIEKKQSQDIVRNQLIESLRQLNEVWPEWRSDIGRMSRVDFNGPLKLLKTWYGDPTSGGQWLTKEQYQEIGLGFNAKVVALIEQAAYAVCNAKSLDCEGFQKVLQNLGTRNFLADTGKVAACFGSSTQDPKFSAGSIAMAKMTVEMCTAFAPDVKINEATINQIIDALVGNATRFGDWKSGKTNQSVFDLQGVPEQTQDQLDPDLVSNDGSQVNQNTTPFDANQTANPKSPVQPVQQVPPQMNGKKQNPEQQTSDVWQNPETILFASQILLILRQYSFGAK
jgi:hypothetical protein